MGDAILSPASDDTRYADHERRISTLESSTAALQSAMLEMSTEGRIRAEFQDKRASEDKAERRQEIAELKGMISLLIAAQAFFKRAGALAVGAIIFAAVYGERLVAFFRALHS